jgi:pyruvate formate lyase activating enzyme
MEGGSTYCSGCGHLLIGRNRYVLSEWNLTEDGACKECGTRVPGRFESNPGTWGARRQPVRLSEFRR